MPKKTPERGSPTQSFKFTHAALEKLKPKDTAYIVRDTATVGLQCRVAPSGIKTLSLFKRIRGGQSRRIKICRFGELPLTGKEGDTVATRCQMAINNLTEGIEPDFKEKKAYDPTLGEAWLDYMTNKRNPRNNNEPLSPKTLESYRTVLNLHLYSWKKKRLSTISPAMLKQKFIGMDPKHKATANKVIELFKAVYQHCYQHSIDLRGNKILPPNPVTAEFPWYTIEPRHNIIEENELINWWGTVELLATEYGKNYGTGEKMRDYFQLVLLTGLRRREASNLTWDRVNLDNRSFIIDDTKNRKPLELPIGNYVYKLLKRRHTSTSGDTVFDGLQNPAPAKAFITNKERFGKEFSTHDLRRTFITIARNIEMPEPSLKAIINHAKPSDVTSQHYDQMDVERLRAPMQRIEDYILGLAGVKKTKIQSINTRRKISG